MRELSKIYECNTKTCPSCGSSAMLLELNPDHRFRYEVTCRMCRAYGAYGYSIQEAVDKWNTIFRDNTLDASQHR